MQTAAKKQTKRETAIQLLQNRTAGTRTSYKGIDILTYEQDGKPVAAIWHKGHRPTSHYKFQSEERRTAYIQEQMKREDNTQAQAERYKAESLERNAGIKAGSILVSSWGYEQTNIDFYKVISRAGDTLVIVEIGQKREYGHHGDRGECTPDPDKITGQPFRKRINKHGSVTLNSFSYCALWDGRPKYWSSYA